jgi:PadR family transcriptional regulator PadR
MTLSEHAPLGVLEEQVMIAVVRTRDEAFGMNVRRELENVTGREFAIGAVYATLDRLEAKGLLNSTRTMSGAPTRRCFDLTRIGARALADTHALRAKLWHGIDLQRVLAPTHA